jgi:hypothetical protein
VVVINEAVSVSSEDTDSNDSVGNDSYHPKPKRQKLAMIPRKRMMIHAR